MKMKNVLAFCGIFALFLPTVTVFAQEGADAPATTEADIISPTVISAEAEFIDTVTVSFSEEVLLPQLSPEAEFTISEEFDSNSLLDVLEVKVSEDDPEVLVLTTDSQLKGISYTLTVSANITDKAGNPIVSGITDTASFIGTDKENEASEEAPVEETETPEEPEEAPEEVESPENSEPEVPVEEIEEPTETEAPEVDPIDEFLEEETEEPVEEEEVDVTPPEDVTNLLLSFEKELDLFLIKLRWVPSLNTAGDLVDQLLYTSLDRGVNYGVPTSLGPIATSHELSNMEGGKEYTLKITTKDLAGNESVGIVKSIRLPSTGPATLAALGMSLAAGAFLSRRKKNK